MTATAGIVVAILAAVFASVTAPLLLARRIDHQHREDRDADWARQDAVAAKAEEAARLLKDSTEQTHGQLEAIHTAVNSNLTARMTSELIALRGQLALMRRLITDPSVQELDQMVQLERAIHTLEVELTDRGGGVTDAH